MRQIPLPIGAAAACTFENFVVGSNAATLTHLRALQPGAASVYVWGPTGCGKSHLVQAVQRRHLDAGVKVASFGAGDAAPWDHDEQWGIIVIDDCDRLDLDQQHCAFTAFVLANAQHATIVAAGRVPPVDLPLREDLRSRLGWGHVMALQPLTEPEARAALRRDADRRGILLSDDVMAFLLTRFARDLKSLFDLLDRIDQFSLANKRHVTTPLLRQMLSEQEST
jgi:DnaA-homolog protein